MAKNKGGRLYMERYGYIRVSTKEQNPERQLIAMQEQQIAEKNIYLDKVSGKNFDRPQYCKLLKKLKKGDVLIVKSIDRLGRNYAEILEEWRKITKEIGADIQVLDMPLLNTNSFHEDLTGVFVSDLVLQILAYVAETERAFIKQRQAEGITVAKNRGVKFGCRKNKLPDDFEKYYQLWINGDISIRKAAQKLGMNYTTFYRRCLERKEKDKNNCCKL
jgi:DNA invertase Pin-like site-specific DNA recombinase